MSDRIEILLKTLETFIGWWQNLVATDIVWVTPINMYEVTELRDRHVPPLGTNASTEF